MALFRRPVALALVLLAALARAPAAAGAPMYTDFATIRAQASIVALGTVRQTAAPNGTYALTVDVDRTLRGAAALGPLPVKESPDGHVTVDHERVVAIIDRAGALRWVGRLVAGASLEAGVLRFQGFFDENAHLVRPGLMTLADMQRLFATGQLDQTFDATLAFRDGRGGLARSSRTLTIEYARVTRALHVSGSTPACLRPGSLFGLDWGAFELGFDDACPSLAPNAAARSLELEGRFTGVDPRTGHIQVELVPSRPFLSEAEYATFSTDGAIATMTSVVSVALSDGTTWTWRVGKDLVDPRGAAHAAGGVSSWTRVVAGKEVSGATYDFAGGEKLTVSPGASAMSPGGNPRGVVTQIDSAALVACTFQQSGHEGRACRLAMRPSLVVRR